MGCAEGTALPAGTALAVDRELFSRIITDKITSHPMINLIRQEITEIPSGFSIIATGPLTSPSLCRAISQLTGEENLYFYDAIAPIIIADSIDMEIAFRGSRYGLGDQNEGDYINCPFNKIEYEEFVEALVSAKCTALRDFENGIFQGIVAGSRPFFEGCLPIEVIARRGLQSLAFGPMRPIGMTDPRTGRKPYAIIQLRQDNIAGSLFNMVGFQTNLTHQEQKRIFHTIPGLQNAEFVRYGQMHRNTYIASPKLLLPTMQYRNRPDLFFAGQITGVEGYVPNIGTGLLAGWNISRMINKEPPVSLPPDTLLGALCRYITKADIHTFQPMKANFGILPSLNTKERLTKRERSIAYAERAINSMEEFLKSHHGSQ
jgi:methylenetetrahydrofolate--tRNA-(uracil-5-)-methyltransferase